MSATRPPAFDDRFSTPIEASRRGAHRARPKPASAGLPVVAGIVVILLVLGGGYVMLKGRGGVSDTNLAAASAVPDDGDDAATATATAGGAAKTTAPADDAEQPAATSEAGAGGAAKVNRDIRFKLLNSTAVAGLAKRVKVDLEGSGWKVADADTGNSRNRGLAVTKIYFGRASTKATAQALKKDLGYGTVVKDASALIASDLTTSDLAVVLGADAK